MPRFLAALLLSIGLAACHEAVEPTGDGGSGVDGMTGETCGPDRVCPTAMPSVGGACEASLSCDYTDVDTQWRFECASGGWTAINTFCPHDGICVPPLGQSCTAPFTGTLPGATVEIGTATAAFRPFTAGEGVPIVIGPQGGVMLQARVRVTLATPPSCVELESELTVNGTAIAPISQPLALHCGLSQPVFLLLPVTCGEAAEHDVAIRIAVTGAGETNAVLRATGGLGPCPRG